MTPQKAANINLLEKKSPGCKGFLKSGLTNECITRKTKSGEITLQYKGRLLHSAYDPYREGNQFAQQQGISRGNSVLLYGFALGYHVEAILNKIGSEGKLWIMELNGEIMEAACSARDLSTVFSDPRVSFLLGETKNQFLNGLNQILKIIEEKNGQLVFHSPSYASIPNEFKEIANALELIRMEKRTAYKFSGVEGNNFERNRSIALTSKGVSELFNKYSGKPGIMVSAGPSLDIALPYLQLISREYNVLSTDTAFQVLVDAGIIPDFVVTIDPQSHSLTHFKYYFYCKSTLLFSPTSNPDVVKYFHGEKMVFTTPGQKKYFKGDTEKLESKGESQEGGSVSCVGLDLMVRFGFNPIVMVGQDCCFSMRRCYASGNAAEKLWKNSMYGEPLAGFHQNSIQSQKVVLAEDRFGGKTPTHQNLYSYRGYIEQIARTHPDIKFFNFHSMGLPIETVDNIFSFGEICKL